MNHGWRTGACAVEDRGSGSNELEGTTAGSYGIELGGIGSERQGQAQGRGNGGRRRVLWRMRARHRRRRK
jgi:hypothetical protein